MKAVRALGAIVALGLVGLLIWAVQSASPHSGVQRIHQTLLIDPGETFAPAPTTARPALTPDEAFASTANSIRTTHLAPDNSVYLGMLTPPIGGQPSRYFPHGELAYGYASPAGCVDTGF